DGGEVFPGVADVVVGNDDEFVAGEVDPGEHAADLAVAARVRPDGHVPGEAAPLHGVAGEQGRGGAVDDRDVDPGAQVAQVAGEVGQALVARPPQREHVLGGEHGAASVFGAETRGFVGAVAERLDRRQPAATQRDRAAAPVNRGAVGGAQVHLAAQ